MKSRLPGGFPCFSVSTHTGLFGFLSGEGVAGFVFSRVMDKSGLFF